MAYEDHTATELAQALETLKHSQPDDTGSLAFLDAAALRWSQRYPQLVEPRGAFAQARGSQWSHSATAETWQRVLDTADALATELRKIGDIELDLCPEETQWGPCHFALAEDGHCRAAANHLNATGT